MPSGRVYNHYKDLNENGDFADEGEDLDTDGDGVPNSDDPNPATDGEIGTGHPFPRGEVELPAYASEPDKEDQRAADDWGNPGKNHTTINFSD